MKKSCSLEAGREIKLNGLGPLVSGESQSLSDFDPLGKVRSLLWRQAPAKLVWTQLELRVPQTQADDQRASTGDRHLRSFLGPQHPARIEVALNPSRWPMAV